MRESERCTTNQFQKGKGKQLLKLMCREDVHKTPESTYPIRTRGTLNCFVGVKESAIVGSDKAFQSSLGSALADCGNAPIKETEMEKVARGLLQNDSTKKES